MKKTDLSFFASFCFFLVCCMLNAQNPADLPPEATEFYEPVPPKVQSEPVLTAPPSDAIILFDGTNLDAWQNAENNTEANWNISGDALVVNPGAGAIKTKQNFADVQLHVEWKSPAEVKGEGQGRGNSGIFLMDNYEVQVLDSYENETYTNGQAASIYKQSSPLVNATNPPSEWNSYDIIFTAPEFDKNGMVLNPAKITVLHNGVVVQNNFELKGPTVYTGIPHYTEHAEKLPIVLQDHGNPVSFRNIWVRELD
ncbi:DUF1080 domain-containing protein [Zunongwangia sp. F363]|uniref:DUF1080 domain-containing protein n=1 Tax=Autumnicola tepida TaxID=3075595 RepID=A0ABU3CB36_9FLAO|nr:DUF1080 domain-containing protein [Zunongwangia sp. F363]MDT0643551.1 DUF1080 domain-containing protein [Zunongwangia sp. F363]